MFEFVKKYFKKPERAAADEKVSQYEKYQCLNCDTNKVVTVLRMDTVINTKFFCDRFTVGAAYEVANIVDSGFVLRRKTDKVAVGLVNFFDFYEYFTVESSFKGWTPWMPFAEVSDSGSFETIGYYRTNMKKVQVKLLDGTRGEASCNTNIDKFDFEIGLKIASLRCKRKVILNGMEDSANIFRDEIAWYGKHLKETETEINEVLKRVQVK